MRAERGDRGCGNTLLVGTVVDCHSDALTILAFCPVTADVALPIVGLAPRLAVEVEIGCSGRTVWMPTSVVRFAVPVTVFTVLVFTVVFLTLGCALPEIALLLLCSRENVLVAQLVLGGVTSLEIGSHAWRELGEKDLASPELGVFLARGNVGCKCLTGEKGKDGSDRKQSTGIARTDHLELGW